MAEHIRNALDMLAVCFDLPILEWIRLNLTNPVLDTLMPLITTLGNGGFIWITIALVLLFTKKYRRTGLAMAFSLLMGLVVCNLFLKPWVARIRPFDFQAEYFATSINLLINRPHDYSFPSGHTIASFEGCTALMLGNKKFGIPALTLAILTAFSRLYLYVHYPSDVLFSVVLGTLFGILGHMAATRMTLPCPLQNR